MLHRFVLGGWLCLSLGFVATVIPGTARGGDRLLADLLLDVPGGLPASFPKPFCTGIRGNGPRLFAHFGALAQLAEHAGPPHCAAGGSSGAITTFLIESIQANPLAHVCAGWRCGRDERWARNALLYKSAAALTGAGLGADFRALLELEEDVRRAGVPDLLERKPAAGVAALVRVLRDRGGSVNPEVFALLAQSPDPVFHARDLIRGLGDAVALRVDSPLVFLRPGLFHFPAFVEGLGRIGSFYAGYGEFYDRAGVEAWLDACARASIDRTWEETAALRGPGGRTCGAAFAELVGAYGAAFEAERAPRNRLDDAIGVHLPVLVGTSVVGGEAVVQWEAAREQYWRAERVHFAPGFEDMAFGYFGQRDDLRRVHFGLRGKFPGDPVTERFVPLGPAAWREVLHASPAEPGFAPAVPLTDGRLSVGGFADPLRVQVLRALGGLHVVTVHRRGRDSLEGRTPDLTRLLGADERTIASLYALDQPDSSLAAALRSAAGVWCTNWDAFDELDVDGLFADGYLAPLRTADPYFLWRRDPYPGASPDVDFVGCGPGELAANP